MNSTDKIMTMLDKHFQNWAATYMTLTIFQSYIVFSHGFCFNAVTSSLLQKSPVFMSNQPIDSSYFVLQNILEKKIGIIKEVVKTKEHPGFPFGLGCDEWRGSDFEGKV